MDPTPSSSAVLNPAKKRKTRQKYSCAECRRLKIKCSRTWPCDACVKGGCEKICPDGQLRKSQGRRIFVNDPEDTSYALFEAGSNVQYPEQGDHRNDPDRQVQSTSYPSHPARPLPSLGRPSSSSNPHPANGYKHGPKLPIYKGQTVPGVRPTSSLRHTAGSSSTRPNDAEEQLVGSTLGTLRSGKENVSRYVGKLAGSEYLQDLGRDGEEGLMSMSASPMPTRGPATIEHQRSSNIGTKRPLDGIEDIRAKLPDWETEGRALVDTYWNNVDWIQQAIPRPVFDGDFLLNAYDTTIPPNLHKIAVVFLVMALGVMFDLSGEPYRQRGADLFALGRACIEHEDGGQASLATVQAALLSGTYILNDNNSSGAETFWPIIGSAIKTAQSIGLHRDGTLFDLSDYEVQCRRQVWWELITYDRLQALCFGRPCSTRNQQTDTEFPEAEDSFLQDRVHYHGSKHRLIHKTERVIDLQNQITPLSYSSILDADAELEEFRKSLPVELLGQLEIEDLPLRPTIHPHTVLQRFGIRLLVAQTRLYLNKPAFSRALSVDPVAPDQSSFGGSFFALYHSAQEIIHLVKQLVLYRPSLIARLWAFWFHAFSASVCLAAIVIQAPRCRFAGEALTGLSIICDISAAAREGCRAKKGLHTLLRLRRRAQESLELVTSPQIGVSNLDTNAAPGVSGQTPGFADSTTPYRNPFDLTHSPADETVVHTPAKTLVLEKQPVVSIDPEPVPMFMGDPAGGGWNDPIPPAVAGVNIDLSLGFNFEEFLNEIREDNFSFMP